MFDFLNSIFGSATPGINPAAGGDWLNQVAGLGAQGDPTADWLKTIGVNGAGNNDKMKKMKMLAGLSSIVPGAQYPQVVIGRAPGINAGQTSPFQGMSPYGGLLRTVNRPTMGGLL